MTITASVVADSISTEGHRLTTLQLRYPRFIHSELMSHRCFSRNASSSRAIPVERMIQDVIDDTAMPIFWGKNQKGMQAYEEHDDSVRLDHIDYKWSYPPEGAWVSARDNAIMVARAYAKAGYHKQIVNRLLEPFAHINVIVTATDWDNFFELRDHPAAQPEIRELAVQMRRAMKSTEPTIREFGQWHLPYVNQGELLSLSLADQRRVSAARCARVSYMTHEGKLPDVEKDLALFDTLATERHMSPMEHQAKPCGVYRSRNFLGWCSQRSVMETGQ